MPYRDELESLRARCETLSTERDDALARLERARAALASAVADMSDLPPSADIPWRSLHGGEPLVVRFVNATDRKLDLVWVSYDGQERVESSLVPGGEIERQTYVAHLWRFIDRERAAIAMQAYVRAQGAARIVAT